MAKESTKKAPETLEEALGVIATLNTDLSESKTALETQNKAVETLTAELTASKTIIDSAKTAVEDITAEMDALKEKHAEELAALKSEVSAITKEVAGTYTSKKHKGKVIKFKTGFVNTRVNGSIVPSKDIIENKGGEYSAFLDNLIAIGYNGIEEVK